MAKITIVGAGILGMTIASQLSRYHQITIVAKNLPGDDPSIEWTSPWAGVSFIAGDCSSPTEVKMQLDAFAELWRWSFSYPDSSIRRVTIEDFHDDKTEEDIWWKDFMPEFRFLPPESLPEGSKLGISYKTIVLNPEIFLPWLRRQLESMGVQFKRQALESLSDVRNLGHDVLINATGFGSLFLNDVRDTNIEMIRGQTILVKSDYNKLFMRDTGDTYTYVIPRLDGTVVLGGSRHKNSLNPNVDWNLSNDILQRIHKNLPNHFSPYLADYQIVKHNVGIRPGRTNGIRVEKEVKNGQKIVHAYGAAGGGYIFSFGIARAARDLVEEFLFPEQFAKL